MKWTFAQYREFLNTRSREVLSRNPARLADASQHDVTVWTLWDASVERAGQQAAGAPAVLGVLAYLSPDFVPRILFDDTVAGGENVLERGDPLHGGEAFAALARHSLIEPRADAETGATLAVSVHRLVQGVTRLRHLDDGRLLQWCKTAVRLVYSALPADTKAPDASPWMSLLEPNIITVSLHAQAHDCELPLLARVSESYGEYLQSSGSPLAAPSQLEAPAAIDDRVFGSDEPRALNTRQHVAHSYWSAGRVDEATEVQRSVLADFERVLERDHPDTLTARGAARLRGPSRSGPFP
jgi:hypothetical protein